MVVLKELTIRPTTLEDAPFLVQWLQDQEILRWFPMINQREIEDAVRIWMTYQKLEAGLTAIWQGAPCGMAVLYIQPYKKLSHQCVFAIIVDKEYRNKGIGSVLLTQLMKHAKEKFHLEILHLEVYSGNPAIHLYQRLGFKEFGYQSHFIKEKGEYLGKIFMQKYL